PLLACGGIALPASDAGSPSSGASGVPEAGTTVPAEAQAPSNSPPTPPPPPSGVPGPPVPALAGIVLDLETGSGIPKARVCVFEHPEIPCDTTDAGGHYVIGGLPEEAELLFSVIATDYYPVLLTVRTNGPTYDDVQ